MPPRSVIKCDSGLKISRCENRSSRDIVGIGQNVGNGYPLDVFELLKVNNACDISVCILQSDQIRQSAHEMPSNEADKRTI